MAKKEAGGNRNIQIIIQEEKESLFLLLLAMAVVIFCSFQVGKIFGEDPESIEGLDIVKKTQDIITSPSKPTSKNFSFSHSVVTPNMQPTSYSIKKRALLTKQQILTDKESRISANFKVPDNLQNRVGFWYDVYTKYNSNQHIIHHQQYPWVIFEVVDLNPFFRNSNSYWKNYHRSQKFLKNRRYRIVKLLKNISRKKYYSKLNKDEQALVQKMSRLANNPRQIILSAHKHIRTQTGQKNHFLDGIKKLNAYKPHMEKIFSFYDLPIELTRIPLVESSFNHKAVSKVGASGVWQFMPHLGKQFLNINKHIDERNSPLKATSAAAKVLRENFINLRSWPLAVSAYNHGPNLLRRASKAVNSKDLGTMILKYNSRSFGFASKNFYPSFLAALYAETYKAEIFGNINLLPIKDIRQIKLKKSRSIKSVLRKLSLPASKLIANNPDIKRSALQKNIVLPKGTILYY